MIKKQGKPPGDRKMGEVLTIRMSAEEKQTLSKFATEQCINLSALARKLLLQWLQQKGS